MSEATLRELLLEVSAGLADAVEAAQSLQGIRSALLEIGAGISEAAEAAQRGPDALREVLQRLAEREPPAPAPQVNVQVAPTPITVQAPQVQVQVSPTPINVQPAPVQMRAAAGWVFEFGYDDDGRIVRADATRVD